MRWYVIAEALNESRRVFVVWFQDSINSTWVIEEAEYAKHRSILPPLLLDVVLEPFGFRRSHAVDLSGQEIAPCSGIKKY